MNISKRKEKLRSNLVDCLLCLQNLSTYLVHNQKVLGRKKKMGVFDDADQMQIKSNENIQNIRNMLSTLMNRMNATKIDSKHHSPCSLTRMERVITRSLRIIRTKCSDKIFDMNNSHKVTYDVGNNDYSFGPKMNTKYAHIITGEKNISDEAESDVEKEMTEKILQTNDNVLDKIKIMNINCDPKLYSSNHIREQSKKNYSCDIDEDMDVWKNEPEDLSEMIVDNLETLSRSSSDNSFHSQAHNSDSDMDSDSFMLTPTCSQIIQQKCPKNVPRKSFDSPLQSPEDFSDTSGKFRTRCSSESSINSDGSSFIVFDNDADSDSESSYSEESESEESDDENKNVKVHFDLNPKIHLMIKWAFAYRAARKGNWEQIYADRKRFEFRIKESGTILDRILMSEHRENIYQTRFIIQD